MTTTQQLDTIERTADQIADGNGWMVNVAGGNVEFAAPTHGGRCDDDPTQETWPAWDIVEDGVITGVTGDGRCGGCGRLNAGWVTSGTRSIDPDGDVEAQLDALAAELGGVFDDRARQIRAEVRDRLTVELRDALSALADGADPDDVARGRDYLPGVMIDGDRWIAWDYNPTVGSEVITVTEDEL